MKKILLAILLSGGLAAALRIDMAIHSARLDAAYNREMFECLIDRRNEDVSVTVQLAYRMCVPPVGTVFRAEDIRPMARDRAKASRSRWST